MFEKESVVSVIQPTWILGQMFGLGFSSASEKIKSRSQTRGRITLKVLYSCTSISVTLFLSFYDIDVSIDPAKNLVIQSAEILNQLSSIMAAIGTVLMSLIYQNRLTTVVKNMDTINNKLRKFPRWTDYKRINLYSYSMIIATVTSWIYFYMTYMSSCSGSFIECTSVFMKLFTITKIFDVNLLRFLVQMCIMWHEFRNINDNIRAFSQEKNPGTINLLGEIERINNMEKLKRLYVEVSKLSRDTNEIFSISLLLIICNQFVSIFSSMYFCFFGYYLAGVFIQPRNFNDFMTILMSSIHPIGQLLVTVTICQATVNESRYTGLLIYQIPISRATRALMKKINLFSMHMLHREFDITAAGFFSINSSLLLMIVGAVTAYLVMFIQFDLAAGKRIWLLLNEMTR